MLAKVLSAAVVGLNAVPIEVEVDIASQGLPSFTIVGLPDKAVEEAKERVRSAIRNSGADFPARRITVNLAPADLPKAGPAYDLPIAIGILLASGQLEADLTNSLAIGELSLDGRVRKTNGILPQVMLAKDSHLTEVFLPQENSEEASIITGVKIYGIESLKALFYHLTKTSMLNPLEAKIIDPANESVQFDLDMKDVKGQHLAKRACEIAAAGGHNMRLSGPPGAGKTLLARTLPSILPTLTFTEAVEVTKIYSIAGLLDKTSFITNRPFRSPHHTTSLVGLIGGSSNPRPGEVTLSHRGVLFLDEFPEFPRQILEALRQPLEDGEIHISRANGKLTFPAKCMLVVAQNPCPCGYLTDKTHRCICSQMQIARYQKKISGPLLDRIDIHLEVPPVEVNKLTLEESSESSDSIRQRVQKARDKQAARYKNSQLKTNSELSNKQLKEFCPLSADCLELLKQAIQTFKLSGRAYHRIIKLARTIADLEEAETITTSHIAEALQYRPRLETID